MMQQSGKENYFSIISKHKQFTLHKTRDRGLKVNHLLAGTNLSKKNITCFYLHQYHRIILLPECTTDPFKCLLCGLVMPGITPAGCVRSSE